MTSSGWSRSAVKRARSPSAASEVPRRLYRVISTWPNGFGGPVTGSFAQPLTWTWAEAQEWIERCKAREANSHLTFTIEVAR